MFCFLLGIVVQICSNEGKCNELILPSLNSLYQATLLALIAIVSMAFVTTIYIVLLTKNSITAPRIRLVSTNSTPNLELSRDCNYHAFVSHVWSMGQDKAQKLVRTMQRFLPGIKIWLDVDELEDVTKLEESVQESAVFILFYSKGYF